MSVSEWPQRVVGALKGGRQVARQASAARGGSSSHRIC